MECKSGRVEVNGVTFQYLEAFEGMDDLFPKGLEKVVFPGPGHFVHLERAPEINRRIVDFLSGHRT
jgi:pimeloyl-ACP methyl ester carboxylesterase